MHIYCLIHTTTFPLHWGISLPRWSDTGCETYPPGNWIEGQDVPKRGQEASIRSKIKGTRVCPNLKTSFKCPGKSAHYTMLKKAFKCWKNHQLAIHLHCSGFSSRLCNSEASTSLTRSGQAQVVALSWSPSSRARLKSISFETAEWLRLTSGWSNFESNAPLCPIHCAMRGRRCAVLLTIFIYPLFVVQSVESQHFLLRSVDSWVLESVSKFATLLSISPQMI